LQLGPIKPSRRIANIRLSLTAYRKQKSNANMLNYVICWLYNVQYNVLDDLLKAAVFSQTFSDLSTTGSGSAAFSTVKVSFSLERSCFLDLFCLLGTGEGSTSGSSYTHTSKSYIYIQGMHALSSYEKIH